MVAVRSSVMIKKDWDGYGAKYEAKFGIFSRMMLSGGQKHHFLQDSVPISKFCAVDQILRKIPWAQNRRILEGLYILEKLTRLLSSQSFD